MEKVITCFRSTKWTGSISEKTFYLDQLLQIGIRPILFIIKMKFHHWSALKGKLYIISVASVASESTGIDFIEANILFLLFVITFMVFKIHPIKFSVSYLGCDAEFEPMRGMQFEPIK